VVFISYLRKNSMSLLGLDEIGSRKEDRKKKRAENKEKRKKKREDRGGSRLKKVALFPARNAFLLLMKTNFMGIRKKLREAWQKGKKDDINRKLIKRFGFKRENFLRELNRKESTQLSGALGSLETALATAAPIVAAAGTISTGLLVIVKNTKSALSPAQREEFDNNANAEIPSPESEPSGTESKAESQTESGTTGKINPLILLGGAGLIILLLTKKK
jgi:hypothetical protein